MTGHETAHDAPGAMVSPDPVLVYDGACPLCSAWVATACGFPLRGRHRHCRKHCGIQETHRCRVRPRA